MANIIFSAFLLGLLGGFIPGPVLTAIFSEILYKNFFNSLRIIFIALLIETAVAYISILIFSYLNVPEQIFYSISLIGAMVLLWISIGVWKVKSIDTEGKSLFGIGKITVMILSNGVLWTFWITVCVPMAMQLKSILFLGDVVFMLTVEFGWLISTIIVAFIFSRFRSLLSHPKFIPLIFKIFALAFIIFSINMFYNSIVFFLI